ncbi:MAG TPA: efflux RND transporter periplasmic adaptor subunit, partial [Pirellulales bacterium]|nr:efflux RND transporter periplasmic adaptor subunit [Pirellulales bacterium]
RGDSATVTLDALRGREFEAQVSRVAYSIDPKTATLRTEVDLDNREGHLRLGMHGRLSIPIETHRDVIAVPEKSIFRTALGTLVFRLVDGRLRETSVRLGTQSGDQREVLEGLSVGDLVATNSARVWDVQKRDHDGEPVEIDDETEAAE